MISLTMEKVTLFFGFWLRFGLVLGAAAVEPFHRHVIVSPQASSEVYYAGGERQIVAPAPVQEAAVVAAPTAPISAVAPAPHLAFAAPAAVVPAAPLAFPAPAVPVAAAAPAPVAPVVAKVAQFKLSYPQYAYGYSVQDFTTGDNKVAKEVREGGVVKGSYSVADPDGTKRTLGRTRECKRTDGAYYVPENMWGMAATFQGLIPMAGAKLAKNFLLVS